MVVGTHIERPPAANLHAHVAAVSTLGYVGCATGKCAAGGRGGWQEGSPWGYRIIRQGYRALTELLPLELIEVRLKARGVLLCGTCTGGDGLYFDCPPVWFASTRGLRDRMWRRSELCRSISVSVGCLACGGGSGRGGGIRGWEDDSSAGRDFGLRVSKNDATRSSMRERTWDWHIRSPSWHMKSGLRIRFRNAKRNRARSREMYCTNHRG